MSIHDAEFRRPILYLDTQYRAHLYPDTTTTRSLFKQSAANYYMLIANRSSNAVLGYSFAKSDASEGPKAQPVWSFQLPITGTPQILNLMVTFKRANEHVHSQGRVLGDRNVLYKYLNPNLVSIVWESIDSQEKRKFTHFHSCHCRSNVCLLVLFTSSYHSLPAWCGKRKHSALCCAPKSSRTNSNCPFGELGHCK